MKVAGLDKIKKKRRGNHFCFTSFPFPCQCNESKSLKEHDPCNEGVSGWERSVPFENVVLCNRSLLGFNVFCILSDLKKATLLSD